MVAKISHAAHGENWAIYFPDGGAEEKILKNFFTKDGMRPPQ
jgi:hypothetical protein